MSLPKSWAKHAQAIAERQPTISQAVRPFLALTAYAEARGWSGACHAISAVLHVLFREVGFASTLHLGEAQIDRIVFDHSWVEIDGAVFDAAIFLTLDERFTAPPTFRSVDLATLREPLVHYAVASGQPRGADADLVLSTPFPNFMSQYPDHPDGLWGVIEVVGAQAGLARPTNALKARHATTKWRAR